MTILSMKDLDLNNQRVLIRADLNVPINHGKILNDARLQAFLPTLKQALAQNARIIVLSHLGRPKEGEISAEFSLKPVAERLEQLLDHPVRFETNWLKGLKVEPKEIVLCENVRFNLGEEANDPKLAQQMAALCDVFIMDAFGSAHRAQASTVGIADYAKIAAAGPLLLAELEALNKALKNPKRPLVAIVAGSKVSSKLLVLESLLNIVDILILGGGIANTFIAAQNCSVGSSLYEPNLIPKAKELMAIAEKKGVVLRIPQDVVVATEISEAAETRITSIHEIKAQEKILDVGPESLTIYNSDIQQAGTILWNGPIGVFEVSPFSKGTETLAKSIGRSSAFSIAGGGETLAAIDKYNVKDQISYISTGGGAFLEMIEGKTLPAVAVLDR